VIFIAEDAVKLPKSLGSEVLVAESVIVILLAFIVAADKSISYEPVVFEFPRVIFKSPVPRFIVLDMSISEYLLFPLPLIDSLLASSG